jgi:hypothetical protein
MALDHYISQVYLKNFYSPLLRNRLQAIRKSDLKAFSPRAKDVCRIEEGSTNAYLKEDRAIERFLREIEPRYNAALEKLRDNTIDEECIFAIAGFAAFIVGCTPTAMRLFVKPLQKIVHTRVEILERHGKLERFLPALGGKTLVELLDNKTVQINIDTKYPQAMGIDNIIRITSIIGNSRWEILINKNQDSFFFTSDFPAAIERLNANLPTNRILPLAPDLAIRIIPDRSLERAAPDLRFSNFRYRRRTPENGETTELNRMIVRSAEDMVFFRDTFPWIPGFIAKNRAYRIETDVQRLPLERGYLHLASQNVVKVA